MIVDAHRYVGHGRDRVTPGNAPIRSTTITRPRHTCAECFGPRRSLRAYADAPTLFCGTCTRRLFGTDRLYAAWLRAESRRAHGRRHP